MNKSSRLLAVFAILALGSIILILAFSALAPVEAAIVFIGSLVLLAIVTGSYLRLSQALDTMIKE